MDINKKFNEIAYAKVDFSSLLAQDFAEWKCFLGIIGGYFEQRGISNPVVVEIGIMKNAQKPFYQHLFNATHIGIDSNPNAHPDILGNSHEENTLEALKDQLDGRDIDLLFIDANHAYHAVKEDFELYSPLTRHLIALHDIDAKSETEQVGKFWEELKMQARFLTLEIRRTNYDISRLANQFQNMGIGILIKGR